MRQSRAEGNAVAGITIAERAEQVGSENVSDWVEVTQAMIDRFAEATGDYQFIHVDPVRAAETPFGGTIAHGFLTLSLLPLFAATAGQPAIDGVRMAVNYGSDTLRFLNPVPSGSRVRGRFKLLEIVEKRPGQWQQTTHVTVEIEGADRPALVTDWIGLIFV